MLYLQVCMYTMYTPGALDSHEWALDPQELELTRVVCLSGCWKSNLSPQQELYFLLNTEPFSSSVVSFK